MATFETTRPIAVSGTGMITSFVTRVTGQIMSWNDARVTRKALSKLSARELDDIGLCYGDIKNITSVQR